MKKTSTGKTPFFLTYDTEVVIPTKMGCLNHRVLFFFINNNGKEMRANLDLIEEVRLSIAIKNKAFWYLVSQYHNARVKNKRFKVGDMTLRKLKELVTLKVRLIKFNMYYL